MFSSLIGYINWTVDPVFFCLGPFQVRWYGLLLALGFLFAYLTLQQVFKLEKLSAKLLDKLSVWAIVWTIIGLRLGHFLFYEPEYFTKAPLQILLPFNENWDFIGYQGLASHGAVISLILFLCYFAWKRKMNAFWLLDRLCIVIPIAAALVRIGNLMNHEIVGKITDVAWGFNFTKGGFGIADTLRHPTQLYEAIVYFLLFTFMVIYYFKFTRENLPPGRTTGILLFVIFTARFIIEFYKEVQVEKETTMTLDIGQKLSIPFIIIGLVLIVYSYIKKDAIPHYIEPENISTEEKK
jgi:prolipoprotein diacylglyceryl transferase